MNGVKIRRFLGWSILAVTISALLSLALADHLPWRSLEASLAPLSTDRVALDATDKLPPLPQIGAPDAVPDDELLLDFEPTTAKEINDAVPFSKEPVTPAPPFRSTLDGLDRDRARMCLAIAGIYEAGSKVNDQRPVMQVVLNRVRHPAFPNTVCGVVFQGSERRTGCQFSFTCDGSMMRNKPSKTVLASAAGLAEWMLFEGVDERVGHATHYHTDWVVPYWSSSLNKLAQVNTHIFFIWKGYWGRSGAFGQRPKVQEKIIPQLANYTLAHSMNLADGSIDEEELALLELSGSNFLEAFPGALDGTMGLDSERPVVAGPPKPAPLPIPTKTLTLTPGTPPGRWALDALKMCGQAPECRVVGWAKKANVPAALNMDTIAKSPPDFVFVQELRNRVQTPYWDCSKWEQASTSKCLGSNSERTAVATGVQ